MWRNRHRHLSPTRNTKQLPSQWWLRYQFTCTPTSTRLTEGPGKSLREIHYCRSRIFCIFFTIYIDIFIYYIYLFFFISFYFFKTLPMVQHKTLFSIPLLSRDGLPHRGGRVVGEVLFWVRAGWPEKSGWWTSTPGREGARGDSWRRWHVSDLIKSTVVYENYETRKRRNPIQVPTQMRIFPAM